MSVSNKPTKPTKSTLGDFFEGEFLSFHVCPRNDSHCHVLNTTLKCLTTVNRSALRSGQLTPFSPNNECWVFELTEDLSLVPSDTSLVFYSEENDKSYVVDMAHCTFNSTKDKGIAKKSADFWLTKMTKTETYGMGFYDDWHDQFYHDLELEEREEQHARDAQDQ
jgi:hypothetical protein